MIGVAKLVFVCHSPSMSSPVAYLYRAKILAQRKSKARFNTWAAVNTQVHETAFMLPYL